MATLVLDPSIEEKLLENRAAWGGDKFDEVWEGIYVMSALADNEHQEIQCRLCSAIQQCVGWDSPWKIRPGVNVSDRRKNWEQNFRCPDVVAFAKNTKAKDCVTFWLGGPDFAIEITSPHDRSRDKFDFYAKVGVRELMIVDRANWTLELYRLKGRRMKLEESCTASDKKTIVGRVLKIRFRLLKGKQRPKIEVSRSDGSQSWLV